MSEGLQVIALIEDARDLALVELARPLGEVIALAASAPPSAGPDVLARAGAARAVRVTDPVLADVDYLAIAHVLACAVRHLGGARPASSVVVLAGDRGRGAVGPAVAERLTLPHFGAVRRVEVRGEGTLLVDRACGAELRRFAGPPPVVLVCALPETDASSGTSPDAQVEQIDLATLRITVPELQYRRRFRPAPGVGPRSRPHVVSNVELLGERLRRDGLWPVPPGGDA